MIKQILDGNALEYFASIGLIMFVAIFCSVVVWTFVRSPKEVAKWSRLPLNDE